MLCDSLCWKYGMLTLSVGWWLPCISVPFYLNYYLKVTRQTKKDYLKEKEFVWTENAANSICKSMLGRKHAFCFVAFTSEHCSTARASWVHLITRTLPVCAFFCDFHKIILGQTVLSDLLLWIPRFSSPLQLWNSDKISKLCSTKFNSSISKRPGWLCGARCVSALINISID